MQTWQQTHSAMKEYSSQHFDLYDQPYKTPVVNMAIWLCFYDAEHCKQVAMNFPVNRFPEWHQQVFEAITITTKPGQRADHVKVITYLHEKYPGETHGYKIFTLIKGDDNYRFLPEQMIEIVYKSISQ